MSKSTDTKMEVVVVVKVEQPKEVRYRCAECDDNFLCEACAAHYHDGYKKPSDDREGKYIWVCPGDKPSEK